MFSPDLEYFLSPNYETEAIEINRSKDGSKYAVIPPKVMNTSFYRASKGKSFIDQTLSRFQLLNDHEVRMVSKTGLDVVYDYKSNEVRTFF